MNLKVELEAIKSLRNLLPDVGQRTLATKIIDRNFSDAEHIRIARETDSRGFASVYGAIRRFDAKRQPRPAA